MSRPPRTNHGKRFEADWKSSVPEDVYYYRLKDAGGWSKSSDLRFTPSNDYDCLMYARGHYFALEMKSTAGISLPYKAFRPQQIEGLLRAAQHPGVVAGAVVNFRRPARTFFIDVTQLRFLMDTSDRRSLPIATAETTGVEIPSTLLRTRYRYDVGAFIEQATGGMSEGKSRTRLESHSRIQKLEAHEAKV